MESRLAKVIAIAFHPLIVPTLGFFILFNSSTYFSLILSPQIKLGIYFVVFFNTCFVPALLTLYLKKKNMIDSLEMETTEERKLPYLATAFFYAFTYYLLRKLHISPVIYVFMLGATISLVLTILINTRWKISAHMIGWGGLTGAIIGIAFRLGADLRIVIALVFLVSGLVGYSRLKLSAHTPAQIYSGFLLGSSCQLLLLLLL